MRIVWLLLILGLGLWLWRSGRGKPGSAANAAAPARKNDASQVMIACAHCQVHVPQAEAIAGAHGSYCCQAHRDQAEH